MRICVLGHVTAIFLFIFNSLIAGPLKVEVAAKNAVLINRETGKVLFEKHAHIPSYPASTTKVITALYALERLNNQLDMPITASLDAVATVPISVRRAPDGRHPSYRLEYGGTHMGIKTGETLTMRTLLYGLMLVSANDAANVIAEHVSGSVPKFIEEMNAYVRSIGCKNTFLYNPHGLPTQEHKISAYDLALITREALRYPLFREIIKARQFPRLETNKQEGSTLFSHNALIKPGKFFYPKAIGGKTGYTIASGCTLTAAAEDASRQCVAVVFGCEKSEQCYRDVIALFDAAFNEKMVKRTLFSKGFDAFSTEVSGGKRPLKAVLGEDLILEYYPSEEPGFRPIVQWGIPVLPIKIGDRVGKIEVIADDQRVLLSAPLYASIGIESTLSHRVGLIMGSIKGLFSAFRTTVLAAMGILLLLGVYWFTKSLSTN